MPYEYIRAPSKASATEGGADEFTIPEHLKILETDTDKERLRKRKAVKAIKNQFRLHQCVWGVGVIAVASLPPIPSYSLLSLLLPPTPSSLPSPPTRGPSSPTVP